MKKLLSVLLCICILLSLAACTTPVTTPTEAPAATDAPTEKPTDEPAPTEEPGPSSDEYFLPKEDGCNQLTLYWTADTINYDTSDMWIWFEGADGRGYQMYPCEYGAKCMINVPTSVDTVGFIVRTDCTEPCGTSWGSATKDYDGDRFVTVKGGDVEVYLQTGDGNIYFSKDGGKTLYQEKNFQMNIDI